MRRPIPRPLPRRARAGAGRVRGRRSGRYRRWRVLPDGGQNRAAVPESGASSRAAPLLVSSPRAAPPIGPLTKMASPGRAVSRRSALPRATDPQTTISAVIWLVRARSPPANAVPVPCRQAQQAPVEAVDPASCGAPRDRQGQQAEPWCRAHGCDVAQPASQRAVSHGRGRIGEPEMHVLDQQVGGENQVLAGLRTIDGTVITNAQHQAGSGGGCEVADALDPIEFTSRHPSICSHTPDTGPPRARFWHRPDESPACSGT